MNLIQDGEKRMRNLKRRIGSVLVFLCLPAAASPQAASPPAGPVSLKEAIEYALAHYPSTRASRSLAAAASAGVDLARAAYLPRTDLLLSANRATRNNVFGLQFPQTVLPTISGPVLEETSYGSVWGSAAGALFSWEPFDFGLRKANTDVAAAIHRRAEAGAALNEFEIAVTVADAFLKLLASQEAVRAAQANVERSKILAESVGVLVKNELRPGADEARAQAELAFANTVLIRAEQAQQVSRATLAEWMGAPGNDLQVRPVRLLEIPETVTPSVPTTHPVATAQQAEVEVVRARQHALDQAYYPRFNLQSAYYARGSGALTDGRRLGGLNGLAMDTPNWAVGITVTFPIFDLSSLRARRLIESHNERAEAARYDQRLQELTGRMERARAIVDGARRVAENTPIQLKAARTLDEQARARYQAGLSTVLEVAEAQRLLTQAEIDDAVARLGIWQALFSQAAAEGDMTRLIEQSSR
jgi:outer membrane protein